MHRRILCAGIGAAIAAFATTAGATPHPLPFTYTSELLDEGELEIEQYADFTPLKAQSSANGAPISYMATQFQTEIEYGITPQLELGLYFTLVPSPGDAYASAATFLTEGTGAKERLRYAPAFPGDWPIDVNFYGELVENTQEFELEGKIILQRRFGPVRVDANLWGEYEFEYTGQRDFVANPTLGVTGQITPAFHVGAEGWIRAEFPNPAVNPRPYSLGPVTYVGPTVLLNFGKLWWATGFYGRVQPLKHTLEPGDIFGPVWVRAVIGISL